MLRALTEKMGECAPGPRLECWPQTGGDFAAQANDSHILVAQKLRITVPC